jgi:serpin B
MKWLPLIATSGFLVFPLGACDESAESDPPDPEEKFGALQVADDYDRAVEDLVAETPAKDLREGGQQFAVHVFEQLSSSQADDNIVLSPLSLSLALGMTMNGAAGTTVETMLAGLGYEGESLKDVNSYLVETMRTLQAVEQVELSIANGIWARDDYEPLKRSFYEVVTEGYAADILPLTTVDPINEWVADATHDKIPTILDDLSGDTAMVLVNALYFNGSWLEAFDEANTTDDAFAAPGGSIDVPTMHGELEEARYKKGADYEAVALSYEDEALSLYVFLPNTESSLADFRVGPLGEGTSGGYYEIDWETSDWVWVDDVSEGLFDGFCSAEVALGLPKFKVEYERSLEPELRAVGLGEIFDAPDFSNFSEGKDPFVAEVVQKTFIDVNEEGTEAAAATAVVMEDSATAPMPPIEMVVDRPFFFALRDDTTGALLFVGQITDPS